MGNGQGATTKGSDTDAAGAGRSNPGAAVAGGADPDAGVNRGDLESTLRAAMTRVASFIEDLVEMEVVTRYVVVAPGEDVPSNEQGRLVASTVYSADGDIETIVPLTERQAGSGVYGFDQALLDYHERNVAAATAYRARLLEAVIAALPTRRR